MNESTVCNVCENPSTFENAVEKTEVNSNVRRFRNERFTVWRCTSCGSLHSKEPVDLDQYYADYPFQRHELNFSTRRAYANRLRLLRKHGLQRHHSILDFGCGSGLFIEFLRRRGYNNAAGFDPYNDAFSDEDVLTKTFDAIVSQDVIEHVEEPRDFLATAAGLLRTAGLLAVGTPNAEEIDLGKKETFAMELHQPYHRHILTAIALVKLAAGHGLDVVEVYRRFYYDTLFPSVNTRFIKGYVRRLGNVIDVAVEDPRPLAVMSSPALMLSAVFGYFVPARGNMTALLRKTE